jgi:hypothetical protein
MATPSKILEGVFVGGDPRSGLLLRFVASLFAGLFLIDDLELL